MLPINDRGLLLALLLVSLVSACGGGSDNSTQSGVPGHAIVGDAVHPSLEVANTLQGDDQIPANQTNADSTVGDSTAVPPPTKLASADKVLEDANYYDTGHDGSIDIALVNENQSVKEAALTLNGESISYVARAGHLIAYKTATGNGEGRVKTPEAAIFYTSYIREKLPAATRPITFFWNGGPGSASIFLHMGSWGPKRLKINAPEIPDALKMADTVPLEDNALSLLDQSDLVFVDPPGTGFSTAIAPFKNKDFRGTDEDAQVIADFIISYINKNNRQSSPKYLYGESYGGIRTPIVANLLEQAGTADYAPDPTGNAPKVLAGFILNSPMLNYGSNCDTNNQATSCEGFIPSYAMTADYFGRSKARNGRSQVDYLSELRALARDTFRGLMETYNPTPGVRADGRECLWKKYADTKYGVKELQKLTDHIGISVSDWTENIVMPPRTFRSLLVAGFKLGREDARSKLPLASPLAEPDAYYDVARENQFTIYRTDFLNYRSKQKYVSSAGVGGWHWARTGKFSDLPQSISDIQQVLQADPDIRLLIVHGYEDIATPGFQTELDLEGVGLNGRIPVNWFEGGHMTYHTESSRAPLRKLLREYFAPPSADIVQARQ